MKGTPLPLARKNKKLLNNKNTNIMVGPYYVDIDSFEKCFMNDIINDKELENS